MLSLEIALSKSNKYDIAGRSMAKLNPEFKKMILSETLLDGYERIDMDNEKKNTILSSNHTMFNNYIENKETFWDAPHCDSLPQSEEESFMKAMKFRNTIFRMIS